MRSFLVTLSVTLIALVSAGDAAAWKYGSTTGLRGQVTSTPQISVADCELRVSNIPYPILTIQGNRGPIVTRSPATTGAQNVSVFYSIERWSGSAWGRITSASGTQTLAAGSNAVRLPYLYVQPTTGVGSVRVVMWFTWTDAASGRTLARTAVLPSRTGDFACVTPKRSCAAYSSYIRIGRLYSVGGGFR
jgi:hypothetical protein